MSVVACVLIGLFGLLIGSFLNVVIHRVPRGESVVRPRSRCPGCGTELSSLDNVPVASWLLLRGKCRTCSAPIAARYPLVEVGCAALFFTVAWTFRGSPLVTPAFVYLAAVGLALAVIDLDTKRLPDRLTLPSIPISLVLLLLPAFGYDRWEDYRRAVLGGAVLGAFYFALVVIYPKGMGLGDVKLAGTLGIYLGWLSWAHLALGGFLGFLLGGVVGAALMATGRASRKSALPFGPFMVLGCFGAIFVGQQLIDSYLRALGR